MTQPKLLFDRERLARFKAAYAIAVANNTDIFTFDGHEFYTPYAKYLIEFVNAQFNITAPRQFSDRRRRKTHNRNATIS